MSIEKPQNNHVQVLIASKTEKANMDKKPSGSSDLNTTSYDSNSSASGKDKMVCSKSNAVGHLKKNCPLIAYVVRHSSQAGTDYPEPRVNTSVETRGLITHACISGPVASNFG